MKSRLFVLTFLLLLGCNPSAQAVSDSTWLSISDVGAYGLVGWALATPAVRGDWEGEREAALSLGLAAGVATLGKAVIHEERPDHSDNKSFPSGHTALAFASATTLYRRYGWQVGFPAYAIATLTGVARVEGRKHHWYDAVAGAAIGGGSAWLFTDAFNDKVQVTPWADSQGAGVIVAMTW